MNRVERKLCPYDDRCWTVQHWTDGFCITATSSKIPWPCESDSYTGDPVAIYQNEVLIARDHLDSRGSSTRFLSSQIELQIRGVSF